jgi:hypothetical protein
MKKLAIVALSLILIWPASSLAAGTARSIRYGLTAAGSGGNLAPIQGSASQTLAVKTGGILGTVLAFLGIIFLGLMIAGGLIWMTAAGNEKKLATARSLMVAAAVGLFIVLSAYAIATYVSANLIAK